MNYTPETLDRLAAEYALGTLRGRARARFEALCEHIAVAATARDAWEERLAALVLRTRSVTPAASTWLAIVSALHIGADPVLAFPAQRVRRPLWQQFAVAASLAILAGTLGWFMAQQEGRGPALTAVVSDAAGRPLWRVAASSDMRRLQITVLGGEAIADDRSLELWALPRDGAAPVSLGLVPRAAALSVALLEPQRAALLGADKVAVSLEPRGGSPTGAPTGPVLHVADVTRG
ncbi:MAG: anti-sigma factor [Steroidobacteraceae bacterium]